VINMATGPDHYRKAEELLVDAAEATVELPYAADRMVARAQVHATLALAAATALPQERADVYPLAHEWQRATEK
jgi:hypothetical protein